MHTAEPSAFVYLASTSPRRRELLASIGVRCEVLEASVDETVLAAEQPAAYVERLALAKAHAALARHPRTRQAPLLGADTAVVIDGEILGKPGDLVQAQRMLGRLSGRTHEVWSAVAVVSARGEDVAVSRTAVVLRALSPAEIDAYWQSGEPADKAGAYAIQGRGAIFVSEIRGSYSGVVGLPLFETAQLLSRHGVTVLVS